MAPSLQKLVVRRCTTQKATLWAWSGTLGLQLQTPGWPGKLLEGRPITAVAVRMGTGAFLSITLLTVYV